MSTREQGMAAEMNGSRARFGRCVQQLGCVFLGALFVVLAAGCSLEERSRALNNPNIAPRTIALQVCSNCHGAAGISESPNFPVLAAQSQPYLVAQLKSFKSHGRS
ncbi:c-type cytochrome, partial [Undibacterium sp.]|uniref:c-type cytochrome n=1 Tax=Undibacterium sp. TaxID=1914977 RepID=UPI002C4CFA2B|nr:hypothetical protein [Undibacterium sp.]